MRAGFAPLRRAFRIVLTLGTLAFLSACGVPAPTTAELRQAYADHVESDRVHERGMEAKQAPVVIPQQEPSCSRDGWAHFDCRLRVIFETPAGRRSEEQNVHVRRHGDSWVIDSIN
jgi:hypothetical protein